MTEKENSMCTQSLRQSKQEVAMDDFIKEIEEVNLTHIDEDFKDTFLTGGSHGEAAQAVLDVIEPYDDEELVLIARQLGASIKGDILTSVEDYLYDDFKWIPREIQLPNGEKLVISDFYDDLEVE